MLPWNVVGRWREIDRINIFSIAKTLALVFHFALGRVLLLSYFKFELILAIKDCERKKKKYRRPRREEKMVLNVGFEIVI